MTAILMSRKVYIVRYRERGFMHRPHRCAVGLCVAVIAVAVLLSGIAALDYALLEPQWVLLPDEAPVAPGITVIACDEQPVPLLRVLSSRAPPVPLA
jgi:hypothetical protein